VTAWHGGRDDETRRNAARFRHRYEGFRNLLEMNGEMLDLLANLEADLRYLPVGEPALRAPLLHLLDGTLLLADTLNLLTGQVFSDLYQAHATIAATIRQTLQSWPEGVTQRLLIRLAEAGRGEEGLAGGKAARLGELSTVIPGHVPQGFVVTTEAYWLFLRQRGAWLALREKLADLDLSTPPDRLRARVGEVRDVLARVPVPDEIVTAIAAGVSGWSGPRPGAWAVRSSAVGEDGTWSFAGQFESMLHVPEASLAEAYREVVVSRFTERAVVYRLMAGLREADTPMAVLFLPMLHARCAGVLYTRLPHEPRSERMLVSATAGLADQLVTGRAPADSFVVDRTDPGTITDSQLLASGGDGRACLGPAELRSLGALALRIEDHFREPQDIEWVLTDDGTFWVVQARPLRFADGATEARERRTDDTPILDGGVTITPGRAVGTVRLMSSLDDLGEVQSGDILVASQGVPEIGSVLPRLAGLIVGHGNPAGHLASLLREVGVPSVFGMRDAPGRLTAGQQVGLDATARRVYAGAPWPRTKDAVAARLARARRGQAAGPLSDPVLKLSLSDPMAPGFRASRCRSLHDIVRFCHEKAVAALFDTSDRQAVSGGARPVVLKTTVPLPFVVLDVGGTISHLAGRAEVAPEAVASTPFQALWRGITTPGVHWAGRTAVNLRGLASVMLTAPDAAMRALGDRNYLLVSPEYLNMNARLAYHFAMIDAWVEDAAENNFVNFRFRGGAAGVERRDLRARFLGEVLLRSGFGVDRRGDLVTTWMRRYPRPHCEEALELLSRLMGCARQLDMILSAEGGVQRHVELFLAGDYEAFS